jgi:3-oxoadipate enol-lactonase
MWDPQWDEYPHGHRVLRLDLRGFGRSPLTPGRFSNARDLITVLEKHGFERPALVGNSLGGRVVMEVAVDRPDLAGAVVLVAPGLPGHDWSSDVMASWDEEEQALERGDIDAAVEVNLRTWVDGPRRAPEDVDPDVRRRVGEMQRRAFELQLPVEAEEDLLVPDLADRVGEIDAPTLVVVGEEDVPDMHAIADRLMREIPGARRATIADTAHVPSLERPLEFDEVLLPFLGEVEAD